jgi:molecular chaperone GrpE
LSHSHNPRRPATDPQTEEPEIRQDEAETAEVEAVADERENRDDAGAGRQVRAEEDKIARLETERAELRQALIHRQADFENFRKRIDRERREDHDRTIARLAESLLPVLDNFERALMAHQDEAYEEYRRGFEMIYRQLSELLASHGIVRMENLVGKPFDPHQHHAFESVTTDEHPEGTIVGEVQPGYRFRDRVLRPAQVRVAAAPAEGENSAKTTVH